MTRLQRESTGSPVMANYRDRLPCDMGITLSFDMRAERSVRGSESATDGNVAIGTETAQSHWVGERADNKRPRAVPFRRARLRRVTVRDSSQSGGHGGLRPPRRLIGHRMTVISRGIPFHSQSDNSKLSPRSGDRGSLAAN